MNAHIVTIGDELLIGQVVDTNAAWIGNKLSAAGITVKEMCSISDSAEDIKKLDKLLAGEEKKKKLEAKSVKIIALIETPLGVSNVAEIIARYISEGKSLKEAREMALEKVQRKYSKIHFRQARDIISREYDSAVALLS